MAKPKTSGLGRGLDSIFLDNSVEQSGNGITMLRLSEIEPNPDQPRKDFETEGLASLAESISAHGLIQPLVVRQAKNEGFYQIIAGERRWRASKMAGLTEVPAIVMDADDRKASQLALIENIQRRDLNPIEEASAMEVLLETYGLTQEELSHAIGKSRSAIANLLRLLDLPDAVVAMIREGDLTTGHGKAILGLNDPEQMLSVAKAAAENEWSVRETESAVKRINHEKAEKEAAQKASAPLTVDYTKELAARMSSRMGREISIRNTAKLKRLEISFTDDQDLDQMVRLLCGEDIFDKD